jgi:hypothetical protein
VTEGRNKKMEDGRWTMEDGIWKKTQKTKDSKLQARRKIICDIQ